MADPTLVAYASIGVAFVTLVASEFRVLAETRRARRERQAAAELRDGMQNVMATIDRHVWAGTSSGKMVRHDVERVVHDALKASENARNKETA